MIAIMLTHFNRNKATENVIYNLKRQTINNLNNNQQISDHPNTDPDNIKKLMIEFLAILYSLFGIILITQLIFDIELLINIPMNIIICFVLFFIYKKVIIDLFKDIF